MHYRGWAIDWSDRRYPSLNFPTYISYFMIVIDKDTEKHSWRRKCQSSTIQGLIPDEYNWSDWLTVAFIEGKVFYRHFFKVILIILSSTFMSCILQYSSTHSIQCGHLHRLTFEAGYLSNMPIIGYYKLSSNYHQWDIYIRNTSYICLAIWAYILAWWWQLIHT